MLSCFRASAGRRGLVQGARPVWALCVVSTVRRDGKRWVEEMGVFCEVISPRPTPPDPGGWPLDGHRCWTPLRLVSGQHPPRPSRARACWTLASSFSVFLRAKEPSPPTRCADVGPITRSGNGQKPQPFISFFPHAMPRRWSHTQPKHQASSVSIQHNATGSLVDVMAMGNGKWTGGDVQPSRQWRCKMRAQQHPPRSPL